MLSTVLYACWHCLYLLQINACSIFLIVFELGCLLFCCWMVGFPFPVAFSISHVFILCVYAFLCLQVFSNLPGDFCILPTDFLRECCLIFMYWWISYFCFCYWSSLIFLKTVWLLSCLSNSILDSINLIYHSSLRDNDTHIDFCYGNWFL